MLLGWVALAVALTGLVMRWIDSTASFVVLTVSFAPYFVVPALLSAAAFAAARSPAFVLAIGVVLAFAATQLPLYAGERGANDPDFTFMTFNLKYGEADAGDVVAAARRAGVTALALQELTPGAVERLRVAGLDAHFPHSYVAAAGGSAGVGIWSALPVSGGRTYPGFVFNQVSVTIAGAARNAAAITVFSMHAIAPVSGSAQWSAELGRQAQILAGVEGPLLVGGDFNATHDHAAFRSLLATASCEDAAVTANAGYLATYPADRRYGPLISIDHVLTREVGAAHAKSVDIRGSDHRAVIAGLRLPTMHLS